jgi:predicted nucleic acid-binding protein
MTPGKSPVMEDKVLIDTSAWIDFFRKKDYRLYTLIAKLLKENRAVASGIIASELIRGGKTIKELDYLHDLLEIITMVFPEPQSYMLAGKMGYNLARKGYNLAVVDLLIAQLAIENNFALLTLDKHFNIIKKNSSLNLLEIA